MSIAALLQELEVEDLVHVGVVEFEAGFESIRRRVLAEHKQGSHDA